MRAFAILASLGLVLSAAPVLAQATAQPPASPSAQPRPTTPAPGQPAQTPRPTTPAATPPAQTPATPAAAPAAPVPFPQGAKYAFVDLQALTLQSADGKAATARFQGEAKKRQAEAEAKAKKMQTDQQKLDTGGSLMTPEARAALEKDIERQQREGERYEQDAQAELNEIQQQLQTEYNKKLFPVLDQLAKEYQLDLLFSATESGLIWARPGLDLTMEAVKRMDAAPTPKPTATPPPTTTKP